MKKVQPGNKLRIEAKTFNSMIDAAKDFQSRGGGPRQDIPSAARTRGMAIIIRNKTGADLGRLAVVGLGEPIFAPDNAAKLTTFAQAVGFDGDTPAAAHAGKFAVLIDPIEDDGLGHAIAAGITPASVNITSADHEYADIAVGQSGYLTSGATGPAKILYQQPGTGVKLCVVRFEGGAGLPAGDEGDTLYHGPVRWHRLAGGAEGDAMTMGASIPFWSGDTPWPDSTTNYHIIYYDTATSKYIALPPSGASGTFLRSNAVASPPSWDWVRGHA